MKKNNIIIGNLGERFSERYLIIKGYEILNKNYRTKVGEIDIIATKNNVLAFIEVKTRRNLKYGNPCEAVTYSKQKKIINTAKIFINNNSLYDIDMRFDIIEVYMSKLIKVNHIIDAFRQN